MRIKDELYLVNLANNLIGKHGFCGKYFSHGDVFERHGCYCARQFFGEYLMLTIIEDVKSTATATPLYKLKRKIVESNYGIVIHEV